MHLNENWGRRKVEEYMRKGEAVRKKPMNSPYFFPKGLGDHFRTYLSWSWLNFQATALQVIKLHTCQFKRTTNSKGGQEAKIF